jgi:hypothetical protein
MFMRHTRKAYRGRGGKAPHLIDFITSWRSEVSYTLWLYLSLGRREFFPD